jgi:hypothetical protein
MLILEGKLPKNVTSTQDECRWTAPGEAAENPPDGSPIAPNPTASGEATVGETTIGQPASTTAFSPMRRPQMTWTPDK